MASGGGVLNVRGADLTVAFMREHGFKEPILCNDGTPVPGQRVPPANTSIVSLGERIGMDESVQPSMLSMLY